MATLALAAVGAYIGSAAITGTIFGLTGATIGWAVGSAVGSALFSPGGTDVQGARLSDRSVQSSVYGAAIPIPYGTTRLAGNVIWATDLVEKSKTQSGGKGGGGGSVTTYTYFANVAISIGEPIAGVRRIWADSELVYDQSETSTTTTNKNIRIYTGSETQLPDPLIEATEGVGSTPAYRGQAYVVFEMFALQKYGNRIPNFSFEVVQGNSATLGSTLLQDTVAGSNSSLTTRLGQQIVTTPKYVLSRDYDTLWRVDKSTLTVASVGSVGSSSSGLALDAEHNKVYVSSYNNGDIKIYDVNSLTLLGTIGRGGKAIYAMAFNSRNDQLWMSTDIGLVIRSSIGSESIILSSCLSNIAFSKNEKIICAIGRNSGSTDSVWLINADTFTPLVSYGSITPNLYNWAPAYDASRGGFWTPSGDSKVWFFPDGASAPSIEYTTGGITYEKIVYVKALDRLLLQAAAQPNAVLMNPADGAISAIQLGAGVTTYVVQDSAAGNYYFLDGHNLYSRAISNIRYAQNTVPLSDIVSDICTRAGLAAADIDVTALTDPVRGYLVGQHTEARNALEPLMFGFFFDAVESDNKIRFVKRGAISVLTLAEDDLAGSEQLTEILDTLPLTRAQEVDLPKTLEVAYLNQAADYEQGLQRSHRLVTTTKQALNVSLPMVLTDTEAARICERRLVEGWVERNRYTFSTWRRHARVEPTDVITVAKNNGSHHQLRIVRKDESFPGVVKFEALSNGTAAYTSTATGAAAPVPGQTVSAVVPTLMKLLDIPILRDQDDNSGFYVAGGGWTSGWDAAEIHRSDDGGANYFAVGTVVDESVIGVATTVLGNFAGGNIFDELSSVTVSLITAGELSSASETSVLNFANVALVGNEIVQFKNAVLNANGTYTLSGLLRGRQGTEWAMAGHAAGEQFVLLTTAMIRLDFGAGDIGATRNYKGVSIGEEVADVLGEDFTFAANGLKPLSPVLVGGGIDGSTVGNATVNWQKRTRIGGSSWNTTPLGEASELYDVEIYDSTFATLKRTKADLTSPTMSYPATEQVTDFGVKQDTLYLKIYQKGSVVGRGFAFSGAVKVRAPNDPYWAYVTALLNFNGTNASTTFTDETGKAWAVKAADSKLSTAQKKYGTASCFANGGYIGTPYSNDFNFGAGAFTVEAWVYLTAFTTPQAAVASFLRDSPNQGWRMLVSDTGLVSLSAYQTGTITRIGTITGAVALNAWTHIAISSNGMDRLRVFINGVLHDEFSLSGYAITDVTATALDMFRTVGTSWQLAGYVDDFRITKGIGRYTANFTPPGELAL